MPFSNRLKRDNAIRVMEALWQQPERSRAELARALRLDRSTVGNLVDWMLGANYLQETTQGSTSPKGGRPPMNLRIRSGHAYAIGVEFTSPTIRLLATDLSGDILNERTFLSNLFGLAAIHELAVEMAQFRNEVDASYTGTLGLVTAGVAVSGVVNEKRQEIELSNALRIYEAVSAAEPLRSALNVPTILFNDAQACVMGEAYRRGKQDLLLALIEYHPGCTARDISIGIGLVLRGNLIDGRSIRHLLVSWKENDKVDHKQFIEDLGRYLALAANITGTNEIVLAGDIHHITDELNSAIRNHIVSPSTGSSSGLLKISRIIDSQRAVAAGAIYSAVNRLFSSRAFPLKSPGNESPNIIGK